MVRSSAAKARRDAYMKKWRLANAERLKTVARKRWANMTPEERADKRERDTRYHKTRSATDNDYRNRRNEYALKYEIGPDYELGMRHAMFVKQGFKCAICGEPVKEHRGLGRARGEVGHLDHDHRTGQVRGVLCHGCNLRIQRLDKYEPARRSEILASTNRYIEQHDEAWTRRKKDGA